MSKISVDVLLAFDARTMSKFSVDALLVFDAQIKFSVDVHWRSTLEPCWRKIAIASGSGSTFTCR